MQFQQVANMTGLGKSVVSAIEEKYKMDDTDTDIQIFGLPKKSTDGKMFNYLITCK